MHEFSLTKRIVSLANHAAMENGAARVTKVRLVVGEGSGIVPESVQLYFDQIAQGTPAQGAALSVRLVKPEMRCPACQRNYVRPPFSFACPVCGTLGNPTEIGSEFYVESVELEIADTL